MGNGTASAMARTPDAVTPGTETYFTWQPRNKAVLVRILPQVLTDIAQSAGGDSAEGGGLLLGSIRYAGAYTVTIESIERLEGRFWRGSQPQDNPDRRSLELALARWRAGADRPLSAVGYYRMSPGQGVLGPGSDDLKLIARYFSAPHNVFLFVRPAREGVPASGGLLCWQFGQIAETVNDEFPLEAPPLSCVPAVPVPSQRPDEVPQYIAIRRLWLIAGAIAMLLIAAVAAGFFLTRRGVYRQQEASSSNPAPALSLTAERSGPDYRVTWDRNAPAVMFATGGLLTITDGGIRRVIDLDMAQLKGGSLLYTPVSGDALIQLEVMGSGPAVTESVRVLSPGHGRDATAAAPLVITPAAPAQAQAESAKPPRPASERPLVAARPFTPPSPASSAAVPTPPEVAVASAVRWTTPSVALLPNQPPPVERPAEADTPAEVEVPRRVSDYRPPRPIRQPQPILNQFARQALAARNSGIEVDVEITIDATGTVSSIKPFTGTDATAKRFWALAVEAVRRWKFEPATLNSQAIQSPVTLNFKFGGTGSK